MQYCDLMSLVRNARGSDAADAAHLQSGRKHLAPNDHVYKIDVPAKTLTRYGSQPFSGCGNSSLDLYFRQDVGWQHGDQNQLAS